QGLCMFALKYQKIDFSLRFEKEFGMRIPAAYIIRSVLGRRLKYISCVLKHAKCDECPLNGKCAYSVLFENPIDRSNAELNGRNRAPSPYIIQCGSYQKECVNKIDVSVIFIDKGAEYIGYFLLALKLAGNDGLFKERIKYEITSLSCNGIIRDLEFNFSSIPLTAYEYESMGKNKNKRLNIKFITPFRYKRDGRYVSDINMEDIIISIKRRLNILSYFYGNGEKIDTADTIGSFEYDKHLKWHENSRYSGRQGTVMKLGGIRGEMSVRGIFSAGQLSLLKAASIFNIGKSVSFGLGHVIIEEQYEK
ncbi:MAG: CRISPR system precrRNA processing endoribonuclease RAMP protein Cas6, partial [Mucispirillum sp.]|nr:CRISPR system precrRNA processing endoribonuclease RAMP protein Cas6 [Mucispirillum sp.]